MGRVFASQPGVLAMVAAGLTAVATSQYLPSAHMPFTPAALIIHGSSTNPSGDGIEGLYGGVFHPSDTEIERVNFFATPLGLDAAIRGNADADDVVLTSGWGAANASLLVTALSLLNPADPVLTDTTWILDNHVSRPNGGYGTRYPPFALVGVNPLPPPPELDARILDVGYEYDINSDTPAYTLNFAAMANSLLSYLADRLNQRDAVMPPAALDDMNRTDADPEQHYHYIVDGNGVVLDSQPVEGTITYVTFTKDELPLLAPLRMLPGGGRLADSLTPLATLMVNAGYPDNNPLSDPSVYRPGGFLPPPLQLINALAAMPGAIAQGVSFFQAGPSRADEPTTPTTQASPRGDVLTEPAAAPHTGASGMSVAARPAMDAVRTNPRANLAEPAADLGSPRGRAPSIDTIRSEEVRTAAVADPDNPAADTETRRPQCGTQPAADKVSPADTDAAHAAAASRDASTRTAAEDRPARPPEEGRVR